MLVLATGIVLRIIKCKYLFVFKCCIHTCYNVLTKKMHLYLHTKYLHTYTLTRYPVVIRADPEWSGGCAPALFSPTPVVRFVVGLVVAGLLGFWFSPEVLTTGKLFMFSLHLYAHLIYYGTYRYMYLCVAVFILNFIKYVYTRIICSYKVK